MTLTDDRVEHVGSAVVRRRRRRRPKRREYVLHPLRVARPAVRRWPPLARRLLAAAPVALLLFLALYAVQVISARNHLYNAGSLLTRANDAILHREPDDARVLLAAADREARAAHAAATGVPETLLKPIPLVGSPARAVASASLAARDVARGGRMVADAAAAFPTSGHEAIDGNDVSAFHDGAVMASVALARATPLFDRAERRLDGARGAALPWVARPADALATTVRGGLARIGTARDAFSLMERLTAKGARYNVLFVAMDTLEARPGGGYVGSVGLLEFRNGTVRLGDYQSFEQLDRTVSTPVAPSGLRESLGGSPWLVENSLWWPSFPKSAATAARLYQLEGGPQVDAVFGLTERTIGELVSAVGPLSVPGYAPVVGANFEDRVLYETLLKQPRDTPRKKFLTELSRSLFDRLLHLPARDVPPVVDALGAGVARGEARVWFADPQLQRAIAPTDLAGALPAPDGHDFLLVAEANVTASKANRYVTREISHAVTRRAGAPPTARLTIRYRNAGAAEPLLNPYYNAYVRVYVPLGARLVDTPGSDDVTDLGPAEDGPFEVFAAYAEVEPGRDATLEFSYTLPAAVVRGGTYRLDWVQQPGAVGQSSLTASVDGRSAVVNAPSRARVSIPLRIGPRGVARWLHGRWIGRKLGF